MSMLKMLKMMLGYLSIFSYFSAHGIDLTIRCDSDDIRSTFRSILDGKQTAIVVFYTLQLESNRL